jgi:hypothetical protein
MGLFMKKCLFISCLLISVFILNAQDISNIYSLINKENFIETTWAGQSITLINENNKLFVIRKYFGSGIPVIYETKYEVQIYSENQVRFPDLVGSAFISKEELDSSSAFLYYTTF